MIFFNQHYKDRLNRKLINNNVINNLSFEYFPPKDIILEEKLWMSVDKLKILKPSFFSVTYGANSGERKKTYNIVNKIYKKTGITTSPHITCINTTSAELQEIGEKYWNSGFKSVVALRGDSPEKNYKHKMYALDLVKLLKNIADFDITVAAYPEMHPESKNSTMDIINLKKKVDAGANRAITQFFFNVDNYLRFRDNCIKHQINIDIIPGILPISNFLQLQRFSALTNVCIPKWILHMFKGLEKDLITQEIIGSIIVVDIVKKLLSEGINNFHFYTLNKYEVIYSICHMLRC
ncbi:methylenetetrahydrofolate reductase [Buchnera aphidicola]|uniref:methylenetetrahydrofolate reductase n=1 Tax=Buchnera aphidicola TaxID=9 RepID=UPI003BEEF12F